MVTAAQSARTKHTHSRIDGALLRWLPGRRFLFSAQICFSEHSHKHIFPLLPSISAAELQRFFPMSFTLPQPLSFWSFSPLFHAISSKFHLSAFPLHFCWPDVFWNTEERFSANRQKTASPLQVMVGKLDGIHGSICMTDVST